MAVRLARLLDRYRIVVLILFSAALWVTQIDRAFAKPFWHDEIYTILHAGLPSVQAMWAAARDGMDLSPPLNAVLTRAVHQIAGPGPLATRLPALIGFWTMTLVVFVMVRRRANATLALAGALIPIQTAAYRYSYEARGYGLMLGLFAIALYAWSEAALGRRRRVHLPLLAMACAAALWNHYYAVLTFVPIVAGEVVRQARSRRYDWPMWTALAAGGAALVPLRPLVAAAAGHTAGFWAAPSLADARGAYAFLMQPLGSELFSVAGAAIVVLLIGSAVRGRTSAPAGWHLPAHEVIAGVCTLLIPIGGILLGILVTGAFTPRYALPAVVGAALVIPLLVRWGSPRASLAEVVLVGALALPFAQSVAVSLQQPLTAFDPLTDRPLLAAELSRPGPLAASGSLTFLQFWYYTPAPQRGRLFYVADPATARRFMGSDTFDRGYLTLATWTAVQVQPYDTFIERYREFRVYAAGSGWLLARLDEDGAVTEELAAEPGGRLYRITIPESWPGPGPATPTEDSEATERTHHGGTETRRRQGPDSEIDLSAPVSP